MKQKNLLFILMTFLPLSIWADPVEIDGLYYELDETSNTAAFTSHPDCYNYPYTGNIIIPSTVEHNGTIFNVTTIKDGAFAFCEELTSISIPRSITAIEGNSTLNACHNLVSIQVDANNPQYDSRNNCNAIIEKSTNTLIYGCKNTVIPNTVTSIGELAFSYQYGLTTISIPDNVTNIGSHAFFACYGLTSISIGEGVVSIGDCFLLDCFSLTNIQIDTRNSIYNSQNNCNAVIETASNTLIAGCQNTIIPGSIISIGDDAFNSCTGLTSIIIPSSVTSIGNCAFQGCTGLTSISIPSSVTSIGNWSFDGCTGLASITIPSSVTSIGYEVFRDCSNLPIVNNIRYADIYLIGAVDNTLTTYQIKEGTVFIGTNAFENCSNLSSISIPNSVTNLGDGVFSFCDRLTSIEIPSSVTKIGVGAFNSCFGLNTVVCKATTPPSCGEQFFYDVDLSMATLYVPAASIDTYRTTAPWSRFGTIASLSTILPTNVTITISSVGMATYCSPYDLDFSGVTGVKAYIAAGYNKSTGNVTIMPVTDVPAYTGIFLKGAQGSYDVPCAESNSYYVNMLMGVTEATRINATDGDMTNYILTANATFNPIASYFDLPANRAYLQIPTSMVNINTNANTIGIEFEDGATGIEDIQSSSDADTNWYSLDGRKLNGKPMQKGIYVVNGRKVIMK